MSLVSFATVVVTVQRPAVVNDHGAEVPDYTDLTPIEVPGCVVQPTTTAEDLDDRDQTVTGRLVHAPRHADIRRLDLVSLPGEAGLWRVVGEPAPWDSPLGGLSHLQINLERWTEGVS